MSTNKFMEVQQGNSQQV